MKKTLSVTLALFLICSALGIPAFAQSLFDYEILTETTAAILSYNGTSDRVVIPEVIDGYSITKITTKSESEAFSKTSLSAVRIPNSVVEINPKSLGYILENEELIKSKDFIIFADSSNAIAKDYILENNFKFASSNISDYQVILEPTVHYYDSKPKTHSPILVLDNVTLQKSDYTIEYKNNVNAGTATLIAKGTNTSVVSGSVTTTFQIKPQNISNLKPALSKNDFTYNAKSQKPKFVFKKTKLTFKEGTDYTLKLENNKNVGIAKVKITGKGNLTGSQTFKFNIRPQTINKFKYSSNTTSSYKLSWNKISGKITGYKIYKYSSSSKDYKLYKTLTGAKTLSYTVKAKPGTSDSYLIKAYKLVGDKYIFAKNSKHLKTTTLPEKVTTTPSKYIKKNEFKVKWEKVSSSGYYLQYSTVKSFKKDLTKINISGGSKTSYTIKKLPQNKTYYYRVRAYKVAGGKNYYGSFSVTKTNNYTNLFASYSTSYVYNPPRTTNLQLACKAINNTIIASGETFSFNDVVGERTEKKGYKEAPVFLNSKDLDNQLGGGICQVASTIFNTALYANLEIVTRHQHMQRVKYVGLGRDASIYWGHKDFEFKNNSNYDIKIKAYLSGGKVKIEFLTNGYSKADKVTLKVTQNGKDFKLERFVGGKVNYTAKSHY